MCELDLNVDPDDEEEIDGDAASQEASTCDDDPPLMTASSPIFASDTEFAKDDIV